MRVLVIHNDYLIPGGETITMHEQVAALRDRGTIVGLVEIDNRQWIGQAGPRAIAGLAYSSKAAALVAQAIAEHRPHVVHSHNLFPSLGSAAMRSIWAADVPWVQHMQNYRYSCLSANHFRDGNDCHRCTKSATALPGIIAGCYRHSSSASAGVALFDISRRAALSLKRAPTTYIAVSQRMREVMLGLSPRLGNVEVVYNSFDPTWSAAALAKRQPRHGVVFVGRLTPEKGCVLAMEAMDRLPDESIEIIGDGPLHDRVADWVRHRPKTTLIRSADRELVLSRMASAKVALTLPLWEEPFGRTAIEAISVGTPVISTARGAAPELIDSSVGQLLSQNPEPEEVASAIVRYLGVRNSELEERAPAMHTYARNKFSADKIAGDLIGVYDRAIARHEHSWRR